MSFPMNEEDDRYQMHEPRKSKRKSEQAQKRNKNQEIDEGFEAFEKQRSRNRRRVFATAAAVCLIVVAVVAGYKIWDTVRDPDIASYANQTVSIVGLTEEPFTITPSSMAGLECVYTKIAGPGSGAAGESKAGSVGVYGPTLETFLAQYGYQVSDFRKVKVVCKDGYSAVLRREALSNDIYLSIADGKNAYDEYQQPLRFIAPAETTGKWGYGVESIEFTFDAAAQAEG